MKIFQKKSPLAGSADLDRTLLLRSHSDPISDAQIYPLVKGMRRPLQQNHIYQYGSKASVPGIERADYVLLQAKWDTPSEQLVGTIQAIRDSRPESKIAFLDYYAPLHIPHVDVIDCVDAYVKKQVLVDREHYTRGMFDTNLIEYEAAWDKTFSQTKFLQASKEAIDKKLFVAWNFATGKTMLDLLGKKLYRKTLRPAFLHCRICAPGDRSSWYGHMRGRAYDAVLQAKSHFGPENVICEAGRINYKKYVKELAASQVCFSPFGYGEVCWRDFESIATGTLLLKPDMSHVETNPDIFRVFETYIPVAWDFSDLIEKLEWVKDNPEQCEKIRSNAISVWASFNESGLLRNWESLIRHLQAQ